MRRRDRTQRRAFLLGFHAGFRTGCVRSEQVIGEVVDAQFKRFEARCDEERQRFAEMLAADLRAHQRLQAIEDVFEGEPRPRLLQ
jgi:hypothetical protein